MVETISKNGEVNWFTTSKAISILSQEWHHWHGREREREIWKKPTRQWTNQSKTIDQINQNEQNLQFQRT